MILACHQPNFLPYMGYLYKMYMADVFAYSDEVQFTRKVHHNYNYFCENGVRAKVTVPINSHSKPMNEVMLANWEFERKKLQKRIYADYCRYPYFKECYGPIKEILDKDFERLIDLNMELLEFIRWYLGIDTPVVMESSFDLLYQNPNEDIVKLCKDIGCNRYISGIGAKGYIDEELFRQNSIGLIWSDYTDVQYGSKIAYPSVLDYMVSKGRVLPDEWKAQKEVLWNGDI